MSGVCALGVEVQEIITRTLAKRLDFTAKIVFQGALWLSECWYPTKRQQKPLDSWAARMLDQIAEARFQADEDYVSESSSPQAKDKPFSSENMYIHDNTA